MQTISQASITGRVHITRDASINVRIVRYPRRAVIQGVSRMLNVILFNFTSNPRHTPCGYVFFNNRV